MWLLRTVWEAVYPTQLEHAVVVGPCMLGGRPVEHCIAVRIVSLASNAVMKFTLQLTSIMLLH